MLQLEQENRLLHAQTRAKAKMFEFTVPEDQHINLEDISLAGMLDLTIGLLGDLAARRGDGNLDQEKYYLLFSAQYLSALLETNTILHSHTVLKILASAAYYLAGYPGSSSVILNSIVDEAQCTLMEEILLSILRRQNFPQVTQNLYEGRFASLQDHWSVFISGFENDPHELEDVISLIRSDVYSEGSDEDVLLIDIVKAIVTRRIQSSSRRILSLHSGVPNGLWNPYFERANSIKEFWPSQIKLAEHGVFSGTSAVIQMPTSAGKTRSTEFIIRSSFLARRSSLAVVVAPFRSLCQEIYNDFAGHFSLDADIHLDLISDVLQDDIDVLENNQKSILILTPEKLDYLLRQQPDLAGRIGLIIYDEGHLFDDSTRGPKYELLLSSLKQKLVENTQVILISAVISNAQQIKDWLIGQDGVLIDGSSLSPTSRNIAFAEWSARYRNIQFVDPTDIGRTLFFVPTVLRTHTLENRPRERAVRVFPARNNTPQIASYLGCRLSGGGLTAVFTGTKSSAQKMLKDLIDAYARNIPIPQPITFSENQNEAEKVVRYISQTLGDDSENTLASRLGILSHHANIPHGLRLVTEYSLSNSYFKTVICTSTLAQGVNLPIRYLIVASDRQGREQIKTRDFHNLMGRAGRSGKYTEGTVIFANPAIYNDRNRGGRWTDTSELLNSSNSEPSISRLQFLLTERPASNEDEQQTNWDSEVSTIKNGIYSYLLSALTDIEEIRAAEEIVTRLVRYTLGYSQLDTDEERARLTEIFLEIGREIMTSIPDHASRLVYAKSVLSATENQSLIMYLEEHQEELIASAEDHSALLQLLWTRLYQYSNNKTFKTFAENDSLTLCNAWISGMSFPQILNAAGGMPRVTNRQLTVSSIVDLCEGAFSYDLSTLIGSINELVSLAIPEEEGAHLKTELSILQKKLKYGVPNYTETMVYELGFVDRALAQAIASIINRVAPQIFRNDIKRMIINSEEIRTLIIDTYPRYFLIRLQQLSTT